MFSSPNFRTLELSHFRTSPLSPHGPTAVVTTGTPHDSASPTTMPKFSLRLGSTKISACLINAHFASPCTGPIKTISASPASAKSLASAILNFSFSLIPFNFSFVPCSSGPAITNCQGSASPWRGVRPGTAAPWRGVRSGTAAPWRGVSPSSTLALPWLGVAPSEAGSNFRTSSYFSILEL
jgi:hypothetical protein